MITPTIFAPTEFRDFDFDPRIRWIWVVVVALLLDCGLAGLIAWVFL